MLFCFRKEVNFVGEEKKKFLELLIKDRELKLKLEHLREQLRKDTAVFEAKQDLLMKDRDLFERELDKIN